MATLRTFEHGGQTVTEQEVVCPDCGSAMRLRRTDKFKWGNGVGRLFYGCSRWPECKAVHGAHPDGRPLGIPGDAATKAARMKAHEWLDKVQLSRGWTKEPNEKSRGTYYWLAGKLGIPKKDVEARCHIAMFSIEECEHVVKICEHALAKDEKRKAAQC